MTWKSETQFEIVRIKFEWVIFYNEFGDHLGDYRFNHLDRIDVLSAFIHWLF